MRRGSFRGIGPTAGHPAAPARSPRRLAVLALAFAQRFHHCGNAFFLCLRPLRAFDFPHIFFLVSERELAPEFPGLGIAVYDFFQVSGDLDLPLLFIEFEHDIHYVSGLAFAARAQLRVDRHHVPVSHVHQRTAKGKTVDGSLHWHAPFALEYLDHIEGRLEGRDCTSLLTDQANLEFVLRHATPFANYFSVTAARAAPYSPASLPSSARVMMVLPSLRLSVNAAAPCSFPSPPPSGSFGAVAA